MADLTITAANVVPGAGAVIQNGTAGETITAGQAVYQDATTGKFMKADSNAASAAAHDALGIALNGAANNQPLGVLKKGEVTIGATLTAGDPYYLSDTAGGICPKADVGSGEAVCLLGLAKSTTVLKVDVQFPGVTL